MRRTVHALVVLHFPYAPHGLDPWSRRDLASALRQLGGAIEEGTVIGGTVVVPFQEGALMEVKCVLSGPNGKMWRLEMEYDNLPPEYVMAIAAQCRNYYNLIKNTPGGAGGSDRQYTYEFSYDAKEAGPKAAPPEFAELFKGKVKTDELLYSEACGFQNAGITLLQQLMTDAANEIKSGQRQ